MSVRRLTPGDEHLWQAALRAVYAETNVDERSISLSETTRALEDSRCYLFVATQGLNPVGLLSAYRFPDVISGGEMVYLYDIEVVASQRRCGFGAQLIRSLVKCCETKNVKLIWAGADTNNSAARRSFEITGAELEGASYAEYEWDLKNLDSKLTRKWLNNSLQLFGRSKSSRCAE